MKRLLALIVMLVAVAGVFFGSAPGRTDIPPGPRPEPPPPGVRVL